MSLTNILDGIPVYRAFGQPAYGTIQCKTVPSTGVTVTIDGVVFTYGTDFSGATSPARVAQALVSAIRADVAVSYLNSTQLPIRTFCAAWYNDTIFIFATQPGTGGNSITLATSDSSAFAVSGATLSNGTNGTTFSFSPSVGALTDGSGAITTGGTSQQIFAANSSRKYLVIQNLSAENMYVNFGAAAVANSNSVLLLPNGDITYEGNFIPSGTVSIIAATTGSKFVAKQA